MAFIAFCNYTLQISVCNSGNLCMSLCTGITRNRCIVRSWYFPYMFLTTPDIAVRIFEAFGWVVLGISKMNFFLNRYLQLSKHNPTPRITSWITEERGGVVIREKDRNREKKRDRGWKNREEEERWMDTGCEKNNSFVSLYGDSY